MSSNTFTCEALAEPAKQQQHEVGKEEAPKVGGEKKRNSNKRRESGRDKKAEEAATPKGIRSPSPQPPTPAPTATHLRAPTPPIAPTTTNTTVDPLAPREDDQPISASTLVHPSLFTFGRMPRAFSQPPPASLPIVPSVINPSPFAFGAVSPFTQAPPPPPPQKLFTEVEVNSRLTAAKAQIRAEAHDEIIALKSELEESKRELTAAKGESTASKEQQLETTKKELAKANKELKLTQENLDRAETQLAATEARLDGQTTEVESAKAALNLTQETLEEGAEMQLAATKARLDGKTTELEGAKAELDSDQTAQQILEAELVVTREALVVSNKKLSNGLVRAKLLFLLLLLLLLILLLLLAVFFVLCWFAWTTTRSMQLPLAVGSRIDSAHMYPEETSKAWMIMDEFRWFGK